MKNFIKFLGIVSLALVIGFSMAACGDGGGGVLDGTTWADDDGKELKFTGSNYSYDNDASKGTYTLASDERDLAFQETSPGSKTYKGYYFAKDDQVTADFSGSNVTFNKK